MLAFSGSAAFSLPPPPASVAMSDAPGMAVATACPPAISGFGVESSADAAIDTAEVSCSMGTVSAGASALRGEGADTASDRDSIVFQVRTFLKTLVPPRAEREEEQAGHGC